MTSVMIRVTPADFDSCAVCPRILPPGSSRVRREPRTPLPETWTNLIVRSSS